MKTLKEFILYPFAHQHYLFAIGAIACVTFQIGIKPIDVYTYLMLLAIYLKIGDTK